MAVAGCTTEKATPRLQTAHSQVTPREIGGGMYNYDSNPTLTNCTITSNTAIYFMSEGTGRGGGLHNIKLPNSAF